MLALRSLAKSAVQTRQMSVISTQPLVRVSFAEKLVHGFIMTAAYSAVPVWVLVNLRHYRGLDK